jgi:hypothetical protein
VHSFQGAGRRLTRTLKTVLDLGCRLPPVQQRNSPGLQRYPTAGVVCRRNLELLLWAIYSTLQVPAVAQIYLFLHQKNSSGLQHYPTAGVVRRRNLRFPSVQLSFPSCNEGIHLVYNTIPRPVLFAEEILSCFFGQYTAHCRFLPLHSFNFFFSPKEFIWFTALSHGRCCSQKKS